MKRIVAALAVLLIVAVLAWTVLAPGPDTGDRAQSDDPSDLVDVSLPQKMSEKSQAGKVLFEASCATCHGLNAAGVDGRGPPLVHKIYEPSHHGDESFQRAVAVGVRGHHWRFGDMPPVRDLNREDVDQIIEYVRELQRANGIS